jgi:hypothetical protein
MKPTARLKLLAFVVCLSILASLTSTAFARENASNPGPMASSTIAPTPVVPSSNVGSQSSASSSPYISWLEKAPMPIAVSAFGYAVLGEKIYIIGGDNSGTSVNAVQRYTPSTKPGKLTPVIAALSPRSHSRVPSDFSAA